MSNQSIGMLIREFRQARNLTMKEVCDTDLSIAQLSKFERGVSELTINKLIVILDKLNITIEEFFHAEQEFELSAFEQLIDKMRAFYMKNDIDEIEALKEEQMSKFRQKNIKFFELNAIMLSALLKDLGREQQDEADMENKLIDHLMNVDIWCHYEITLFANSIPLLNINTLTALTKEMISNTKYYLVIKKHRVITIQTLINVILILIEKGETEKSKEFHGTLSKLLEKDESLLYEKNVSKYLNGFYHYKIGEHQKGTLLMQEAITIFKQLESPQLARNYQAHFEHATSS